MTSGGLFNYITTSYSSNMTQLETNLTYWNVVKFLVDTDAGDGGEMGEEVVKGNTIFTAWCSGTLKMDVGPVMRDSDVRVDIKGDVIIVHYSPVILESDPQDLEDEIVDNEEERLIESEYSKSYKCRMYYYNPALLPLP